MSGCDVNVILSTLWSALDIRGAGSWCSASQSQLWWSVSSFLDASLLFKEEEPRKSHLFKEVRGPGLDA